MTNSEKEQLLDAYILESERYIFETDEDALFQVFQAYTNFSSAFAERYKKYLVSLATSYFYDKERTAFDFAKNEIAGLQANLNDYKESKLNEINFG